MILSEINVTKYSLKMMPIITTVVGVEYRIVVMETKKQENEEEHYVGQFVVKT